LGRPLGESPRPIICCPVIPGEPGAPTASPTSNLGRHSRAALKQQPPEKRKGDFSCEISPFLSGFVEDLVRLPNHNVVILKSLVIREPGPRFLPFLSFTYCESFPFAMHRPSVAWKLYGSRYRFPRWLSSALFFWKIALPLKVILTR
jgi:hypothetical protein